MGRVPSHEGFRWGGALRMALRWLLLLRSSFLCAPAAGQPWHGLRRSCLTAVGSREHPHLAMWHGTPGMPPWPHPSTLAQGTPLQGLRFC